MNPGVVKAAINVKVTEPGVTEQASERARQWNQTEVELVTEDDKSFSAMCDREGVAHVLNLTGNVKEVKVRRRGPDAIPISWMVKHPSTSGFVPGAEVSVEIGARLRHSAWVTGGHLYRNDQALNELAGVVDDVSMLETFFITGNGGCDFDKRFAGGQKPEKKKEVCQQIISGCHTRGIQVLCGYEGGLDPKKSDPKKGKQENTAEATFFREFLRNASIATVEKHAHSIYEKIFVDLGLDFDGVSFDLEIIGLDLMTEELEALYGTLASLLARDNRVLAYASSLFKVDGDPPGDNVSHLRSQPYRFAKLAPNIIVRPMGYDGGQRVEWHGPGIDCALREVKLHPSQFQMGVKLANKMGGAKIGNAEAWSAKTIQEHIVQQYRPNRIGMISFALGGDTEPGNGPLRAAIKTFDPVLNPGGPKAGTVATPLQCPRRTENGR